MSLLLLLSAIPLALAGAGILPLQQQHRSLQQTEPRPEPTCTPDAQQLELVAAYEAAGGPYWLRADGWPDTTLACKQEGLKLPVSGPVSACTAAGAHAQSCMLHSAACAPPGNVDSPTSATNLAGPLVQGSPLRLRYATVVPETYYGAML